jgi:hypothetical protein
LAKFGLKFSHSNVIDLKQQFTYRRQYRRFAAAAMFVVFATQFSACLETASEAEAWRGLEKQLQKTATTDEFIQHAGAYYRFYEAHPRSELAGEALFKSAQLLLSAQKPQNAMQRFEQVRERFPNSKEAEAALFMTGYIHNNYFADKAKARAVFENFLAQYPANELATSARFELQYLGVAADNIFPDKSAPDLLLDKPALEVAAADSAKKSKRKISRAK